MPFVICGSDTFVQDDVSEILASEYPDEEIVISETVPDALARSADLEGRLTVLLVMHDDVVRIARSFLSDRGRDGSVVLIRNDPPEDQELCYPMHHLQKPFGARDLLAIVKTARASRPEGQL